MARNSNRAEDTSPSSDSLNNMRIEIEGKLDKKLPSQFFYWACGLLALVLGYFAYQYTSLSGKIEDMSRQIVRIETKIEIRNQSNP